jgi:hypothetical protein
MTANSRLTRRNALKGLGSAATVGLLGGGAYFATGLGAAQASIDITITDTNISNDRGEVNWVGVDVDKTIQWDGFDVPLKYIGFKHEVSTDANSKGWHTLYGERVSPALPDWSNFGDDEAVPLYTTDEANKADGTEGEAFAGIVWEIINDTGEPGSYAAFGYDGGGTQDPAQWASDLSVGTDGGSATHQVTMKTTLNFYKSQNDDGTYNQITEANGVPGVSGEGSFVVTVTNESGTSSTSEGGTSAGS